MSQNKKPYSDRRWREAPTNGVEFDYSQVTEEDEKQTERVLKAIDERIKKKKSGRK
jgi:hypothetical protein